MSGRGTLSPDMQELVNKTVETLKLDIVQGLAYEQSPDAFKGQGIEKNPSKLGAIVAKRLRGLSKDSKFARADYSKTLPIEQLYDADIRRLTRVHNVELLSGTPVLKQSDLAKSYAFVARDLASAERITALHDNLFDTEIDPETVKADAKTVILNSMPAVTMNPAIARMIADRKKLVGTIDWSSIFTNDGREDNEEESAPDIQLNRGLKFRIHRVKCVDETNPEWPGHDKIAAGGVAVDWKEESSKISEFRVGDSFDDGESKYYSPPRVLKTFSLNDAAYPADFLMVVALAEKDNGGLSQFINELWDAIKDQVQLILTAVGAAAGLAAGTAIGGTLGTAVGGPIGAIIGVAAGAIIGALVGWLIGALKDDIFEPQSAALRLPVHDSTFAGGSLTSPTMTLDFRDHGGHYRVYYSWQITR